MTISTRSNVGAEPQEATTNCSTTRFSTKDAEDQGLLTASAVGISVCAITTGKSNALGAMTAKTNGTTTTTGTITTMSDRKLTPDQQRLIENNKGIAHSVAHRYFQRGRCAADQDEIASASLWGLCVAALDFKSPIASEFASYAYECCHRRVREHLFNSWTIKVPLHLALRRFKDHPFQKYRNLARDPGSFVSLDDAAEQLVACGNCKDRIDQQEAIEASRELPDSERIAIDGMIREIPPWRVANELGETVRSMYRHRARGIRKLREKFGVDRKIA